MRSLLLVVSCLLCVAAFPQPKNKTKATSSAVAKPKTAAPAVVKPPLVTAPPPELCIYPVIKPVFLIRPERILFAYTGENMKIRVNEYLPVVNADSIKRVLQLAQPASWPAGINTKEKLLARTDDLKKYKGYTIYTRYIDNAIGNGGETIHLLWFPKSENATMPADMIPSNDGLYMAVYSDYAHELRPSGNKLAPAVTRPVYSRGLGKEMPATFDYGDLSYVLIHNLDAEGISRARAALVGSGRLNDSLFTIIVKKANIANFPAGFNTVKKAGDRITAYSNAKFYIVGSFLLPFNGVAQKVDLIWLPAAENKKLPADLLPADGSDQFFFVAGYKVKETKPRIYLAADDFVTAMKAKHKGTAVTIQQTDILNNYSGAWAWEPLCKLGYTEAEFQRMMELSTDLYLPEGLEYDYIGIRGKELKNYHAKLITTFDDGSGEVGFYWVPAEDAGDVPRDMLPLTSEGAFFFVRTSTHADNKAISTKIFSNKVQWDYYPQLYSFYSRGGTAAMIAQMEEDLKNGITSNKEGEEQNNGKFLGTICLIYDGNGVDYSGSYVIHSYELYALPGKPLPSMETIASKLSSKIKIRYWSYKGKDYYASMNCDEAEDELDNKLRTHNVKNKDYVNMTYYCNGVYIINK